MLVFKADISASIQRSRKYKYGKNNTTCSLPTWSLGTVKFMQKLGMAAYFSKKMRVYYVFSNDRPIQPPPPPPPPNSDRRSDENFKLYQTW